MKRYIIYAGVNGAGKSTLFSTVSHHADLPRVNTDEILREFGDWRNMEDVLKAGKIAVERLRQYIVQGVTFTQETTLCGKSVFRNIEKAKAEGYLIEMHYVGVDSVEIAKARIAKRVEAGGHGIPDDDVERRYVESLANLTKAVSLCNLVSVYDNTQEFRRIAIYKDGKAMRVSSHIPEWFNRIDV